MENRQYNRDNFTEVFERMLVAYKQSHLQKPTHVFMSRAIYEALLHDMYWLNANVNTNIVPNKLFGLEIVICEEDAFRIGCLGILDLNTLIT